MGIGIAILAGLLLVGAMLLLARRPPRAEPPPSQPITPIPSASGTVTSEPSPVLHYSSESAHPTYDIDIEQGTVHWNQAFFAAFGYDEATEQAHTLQWWATHIHPDDAMAVNEALDNVSQPRVMNWTVNYRFRKANGAYVPVNDHTVVVRNNDSQAIRVLGTMTIQDPSPLALAAAGKESHADKADTDATHEPGDAVVEPRSHPEA